MRLEDLVYDYFKACFSPHRNRWEIKSCLDWVRDYVQPVTERMGIVWDDRVELILIDSCLNFSSSWQCDFLTFFLRKLQGYR